MNIAFLILIIEAVTVYLLVLGVHSLRHRAGLSPFYALLGGLTAIMSWTTDAGVNVEVASITFMVGSTVFYTSLLLGIFVVYIFDGPRSTRIAILTVAGVSILMPVTAAVLHVQMSLSPHGHIAYIPIPSLRINTASVLTTIVDLLFLAIAWEFLGKTKLQIRIWLRTYLTLLGVMLLDVILFNTAAFLGNPYYLSIMQGTLVSRLILSVFAFPFLYIYLNWQNRKEGITIKNRPVLAVFRKMEKVRNELEIVRREIKRRKKAEGEQKLLLKNMAAQAWYLKDPKTYGRVNESHADFLGVEKTEIEDKNLHEIRKTDEEVKICIKENKEVFGKKETIHTEEWVTNGDGEKRLLAITKTPKIEKGEVKYVICSARDITERKKMRKKLETLHTWAQRLNKADSMDAIFEYTLDAMEQTLGFEHATIELKRDNRLNTIKARGFETIPQQTLSLDGESIIVKAAQTGQTQIVEDVNTYQANFPRFSQTKSEMATPIYIEGELFGVLNAESTQKHAFDYQDKRLLETLASHVAVTIKKLKERKKRVSLQRLDELRDQFLAMAAHEINTPLTPIKTNLEMLKQEYFGEITEEEHDRIEQTLESVDRLVRLVNDFRQASKLQTAHIKLDQNEHQLADTIEKALKKYKYPFVEGEIKLVKQIEQPLNAIYDEDRIIQVFRNLVENAIDYTDDTIWIHGKAQNGNIHVSVRDNGIGIPEKEQDKIFEPFYRVAEEARSRENRRFGGTGLGLNICKRIVKAHGGEIHVDSRRGEGSTFTVVFPRNKEERERV